MGRADEDREKSHERDLSSKHIMAGRIVSQFRKLKLPLIIRTTYKRKNKTKRHFIKFTSKYKKVGVLHIYEYHIYIHVE